MPKDLGRRGNSGALFRNGTMDFAAGWLLGFAQQGGMSPGALLAAFSLIRDGSPTSWAATFTQAARAAETRAHAAARSAWAQEEADAWGAAQVAWRAALMMMDPTSPAAREATRAMQEAFLAFLAAAGRPLERWDIPFRDTTLPAYASAGLPSADRLLLIIGGGDTYVEDLWFLGGKAASQAGHATLLVDLPGQGDTPDRGLHFGPDTIDGLREVLEVARGRGFAGDVVLIGWSGGGIFTTKYASIAPPQDRIAGLVASTPIHDMEAMFRRAMPGLLRSDPTSPIVRAALALARRNKVAATALAKYDWQFGPGGLVDVVQRFTAEGRSDLSAIDVPVLALVGLGEDPEGLRQARDVVDAALPRHPASRLVTFDAWSGGVAHCQVGNLPAALRTILRWVDALPADRQA